MTETITLHCRQETATAQLAKLLSQQLSQFLVAMPHAHLNIALKGDLGAGKTTFARYLIQNMGHVGRVKSPTYTLCEPYSITLDGKDGFTVHHFDLYRMRDPLEWQEAGFAEHFDAPGFCLIEWSEKAQGTLPAFDIEIELQAGQDEMERTITLRALNAPGKGILDHLPQNVQ
ncbi:tRNA threonylcarbamoyladenosine biosynthesis protein TsaE [Polynucleobacter sphagniphilus]|uniref:tRNA (adenosine(37)-N6)-threonylcarbamoyltransferase complex ATPase subunit type 1 TsaE n=1 Tax=Polynucleobacter sphagniphilus TaxID=1743169 RepID=UPI0024771BE2|nr:tRNA (adenosine(37)-N6)-threonylcarbamoyltransferase complex ATPase subunit type 1 TsaE [Polynucleobacter sphagniphilus]MDH6248639.1 tRNA threonylcarbamoyladenosine biosynthesis protein TsaE [Polynucleobacter sphagniphilus]